MSRGQIRFLFQRQSIEEKWFHFSIFYFVCTLCCVMCPEYDLCFLFSLQRATHFIKITRERRHGEPAPPQPCSRVPVLSSAWDFGPRGHMNAGRAPRLCENVTEGNVPQKKLQLLFLQKLFDKRKKKQPNTSSLLKSACYC